MLDFLKPRLIRSPFWEKVRHSLKHLSIGMACLAGIITGDETEIIHRIERKKAALSTKKFIAEVAPCIRSFGDRLSLLRYGLSLVKENKGLFCEFGVYQAITLNFMARTKPEVIFYGFDSFEGLPEKWGDGYETGKYKMKEMPKVMDNVRLVKGWFKDAIPDFLRTHPENVQFLHIDADLYSSTKEIFENFRLRIKPGTIIVFDEYFNFPEWQDQGECKAWKEFVEREKILFDYIGYVRHGHQLAVMIKSTIPI